MPVTLSEHRVEKLTVADRLELIGLIWDSILDSGQPLPIPAWHLKEIQRRAHEADAHPENGIPWEQVKEELSRRNSP